MQYLLHRPSTRRMNFRITSTIAYQVHQQRPHITCIAGFLGPPSWKKNGFSAPKCHFCDPDRRSRWCGQQTHGWGSLLAANSTQVAAPIVSSQNSWVLQSIETHIHRLMDDRCYTICFCATLWTGIYMFIYIYYVSDVRICKHLDVYLRDENTEAFGGSLNPWFTSVQLAESTNVVANLPSICIVDTVIMIYGPVRFWKLYWLSSRIAICYLCFWSCGCWVFSRELWEQSVPFPSANGNHHGVSP